MRVCTRSSSLFSVRGPLRGPAQGPLSPHSTARPSVPLARSQIAPTSAWARPHLGHTPPTSSPHPTLSEAQTTCGKPARGSVLCATWGCWAWRVGRGGGRDQAELGSGSRAAAAALAVRGSLRPGAAAQSSPTASESSPATARSPAFLKPVGRHLRGGGWGVLFKEANGTRLVVLPRPRGPHASSPK